MERFEPRKITRVGADKDASCLCCWAPIAFAGSAKPLNMKAWPSIRNPAHLAANVHLPNVSAEHTHTTLGRVFEQTPSRIATKG